MTDLHQKFIKIFIWVGIANLVIAVGQLGFAYTHYTAHEYWHTAFNIFLCSINGYVAWLQVANVKRVKQDAKDQVWNILSSKEIA